MKQVLAVPKVLAVLLILFFLIGSVSGEFKENMEVKDQAKVSVDRPLINHVKAFTNEHIPPLYDLITSLESSSGSESDKD